MSAKRAAVIDALAQAVERAGDERAARLLGVRGELLDRARHATAVLAAGAAPALPAWRRFSGIVWQHLDPATLTPRQRRQLVVPSAVLGLSAGNDPVPDFRLKLSVSLPATGPLSRWWRADCTAALVTFAGRRPVVDLLPNEHAAALDVTALGTRLVRVRFVDAGGAAVGHDAKAAKGMFARTVLDGGLDAAAAFEWSGWRADRVDDGITVTRG